MRIKIVMVRRQKSALEKASAFRPQANTDPLLTFLQRRTITGTTIRTRTNLIRTTTGKSFEIGRRTGARTILTTASRAVVCSMIAMATIKKLRSCPSVANPFVSRCWAFSNRFLAYAPA